MLDGNVFCSAVPFTPLDTGVNIADRYYFQRALQIKDFAIGKYQIDRISRTFTINFGIPIISDRGEVLAVLFSALDLSYFIGTAAQAQLPEEAVLTIRDSTGTILFRYPDHEQWFGQVMPEAPVAKSIFLQQGWGTAEAAGIDGKERLYAFAPLSSFVDHTVYLSVGIESRVAFAKADRKFILNLSCLGFVALLALASAWFGGNLFVMNQVNALMAATRRLAAGNLDARCGNSASGSRELDELAHAFDDMAESLSRSTHELQRAEAKYRDLVEQVPAITYVMSGDNPGNILYVSPQLEPILGFSPDEWVLNSRLWISRIHPDDLDMVMAVLAEGDHAVPCHKVEYRLFAKDGREVWVRDEAQRLPGEDGLSTLVRGILRDITDRKVAQDAVRRSEEAFRRLSRRMQLILESAGEGIFGLDSEGRVTFMNPAAAAITGWEMEDVVGKAHHEMMHHTTSGGARYPAGECPIYEVFRDGNGRHGSDEVFWRKDGTSFPVEYISTPIYEGGKPTGAVVCFKDIGERKRGEQERDRLAAAIGQASDGILIADKHGVILYCNPSFQRLSGYTGKEVIGKNLDVLRSDRHPAEFYAAMWRDVSQGKVWSGRIGNRMKDGRVCEFETIISPTRNGSGEIINFVLVNRDITQEVALENQLRHSQKMEAIGTMAGGIAHDFNNILTAILGYTEMTLIDTSEDSPGRRNLQTVLQAAHRAKDLVKQILVFSRHGQELARMPVDVSLPVKEALTLLRATLPSTIEIRQDIRQGVALADPTQVHQVVVNLCTNAAHAMNDKGIIEISLTDAYIADNDLILLSNIHLRSGPYLRLTVSDLGRGMDAVTLERIFDPYFTTKEAGKGTGLGLAVAHGIVKRHEGAIQVESRPGQGTTISIFIPKIENKEEEITEDSRAVPVGTERILLVDDEEAVAELIARILRKLGYSVTARSNAVNAIALFALNPDDFDLVITDYTMPEITGTELAVELQKMRPDIAIILLTGYSAQITEQLTRDLGIRGFALKPIERRQLATLVRNVLDENKV
jgi:PAS domain S-box-containing protein